MSLLCQACGNINIDSAQYCQVCGKGLGEKWEDFSLKPGAILDNRYKIKRLIKPGGMGAVYEAYDERFDNRACAVKEMLDISSNSEEEQYLIKRFKEEAEILNTLRHPNLPVVKDYFIENKRYYLVMDYIEGKDLKSILKDYRGVGIPENTVIHWSKQILDALDYIHNQSPPIVYRDLKPENVMLRNCDNRIILIDFGIARRIDPKSETKKTVIGTLIYSPEEMFQGKAEPRTDIYSMGATMHCLLTGRIPKNPFDFKPLRKVNPGVSIELEIIVMKALGRKPEERYKNATEMKKALMELSVHTKLLPEKKMPVEINSREKSQNNDIEKKPLKISKDISQKPPATLQQNKKEDKKIISTKNIIIALVAGLLLITGTIGLIIILILIYFIS